MARRPAARWAAYLPVVSSPVSFGVAQATGADRTTVLVVSLAPLCVYAIIVVGWLIGYVAASARFLTSRDAATRADMERHIAVSTDAVVSLLTLARMPTKPSGGGRTNESTPIDPVEPTC